MGKFKRFIAVPCVIIIIALYMIGTNIVMKIDTVNDLKEVLPVNQQSDAVIDVDAKKPTAQEKININTADISELTSIDGIGEEMAQKIIDKRNELGGFKSIDQIKEVKGIGDKKFDFLKNYITV